MNVLVTGGAGYIGSHTCKLLKQAGHHPIVIDNLIYGHKWAVQWGAFYDCDLHDKIEIQKILLKENISAVIHFAAFAYVGESVSQPLKYYENNVAGTVALLEAMQNSGVAKFVFSSSCATYGTQEKSPIEETFKQSPINPYGETKLIVEKILINLAKIEKINAVALRYFNASGADADLEIGEDHFPETHLIPLAIEAAYKNDFTLTVFGTDYSTPDGTCIRDYIHVSDLASAHVKALESLDSYSSGFRAYNLGTGKGASVRDIVTATERATGQKVKIKFGDRRMGDPAELVASPGRAQVELSWSPIHSSLENILSTAVRWYKKHHLK